MAQIKYKVQEVAKDFGVAGKDVLELIKTYFGETKKSTMTSLTVDELNVVFEYYTQQPGHGTLADYFNTYNEDLRKQKAEEKRLAAEKAAAEKAAAEKAAAEKALRRLQHGGK